MLQIRDNNGYVNYAKSELNHLSKIKESRFDEAQANNKENYLQKSSRFASEKRSSQDSEKKG